MQLLLPYSRRYDNLSVVRLVSISAALVRVCWFFSPLDRAYIKVVFRCCYRFSYIFPLLSDYAECIFVANHFLHFPRSQLVSVRDEAARAYGLDAEDMVSNSVLASIAQLRPTDSAVRDWLGPR
jgi:hypothetical protein